jgi:hypothetical protein
MKISQLRQLIREEIQSMTDESLPTRDEIFNDFEKMAKDLETKTGAKISTVKFPNAFRFHVNGNMIGWWGGQKTIPIERRNPSVKIIKQVYDEANKWVSNFPERYKDYMSWKSKGEEEFSQEVERKRKQFLGGSSMRGF